MIERRTQRSDDPLVALHYKLAAERHARGLDALVLADDDGLVVAGAGAWPLCEELAAYAPLLGEDNDTHLSPRLRGRVRVSRARDLWLCAVGENANGELGDTHDALARILAA